MNKKFQSIRILFLVCTLLTAGCSSHSDSPLYHAPASATTPAVTPAPLGSEFKINCREAQFIKLLNLYRQANSLNVLKVSKSGVLAARWHAQDMMTQNYFSHTEPSGRTFSQRAFSFGYPSHAENIAAGNMEAEQTFCQWKNSAGHNANMLGAHTTTGVGVALGSGTYGAYWSNGFGTATDDTINEPLTDDSSCVLPGLLPAC